MRRPRRVLPLIVAGQFAGTSIWFVGNAVVPGLQHLWTDVDGALGWITSSVQLGFIAGTLLFALTGLADRFPAHRVFALSALGGAAANAACMLAPESFTWLLLTRLLTGLCLAGVYPVGMKLAASWFREGLGAAIGLLVGALVLGTAFPHLLGTLALDPALLTLIASSLAAFAGVIILLGVPEGPNVRPPSTASRWRETFSLFADPRFRSAAFGYFGHMWELYAFWAFVPFAVALVLPSALPTTQALVSFAVIASGAIGCVVGGFASRRRGSALIAGLQLGGSGLCVLLSPLVLLLAPTPFQLLFLLLWGILVAGDSPHFSALAARSAPPDRVGTGLTLINMIGFAITIPSIQLLAALEPIVHPAWLLFALLPGPVLGVLGLRRVWREDPTRSSG